jgi:patatin-like phospholipase/acyl hydrolase
MNRSVSPVHDATPHPSTPQAELVRPILLSLDGGGVKGLSTLLILQELMERIDRVSPPKPCDVFDMIGGTSTGG